MLERCRDFAIPEHADAETIDMPNSPVAMALKNDIGIVGVRKRLHCFGNYCGIALIQEAAIAVVRVDNRPVFGSINFPRSDPPEAGEILPVAGCLICGFLDRHVTQRDHCDSPGTLDVVNIPETSVTSIAT